MEVPPLPAASVPVLPPAPPTATSPEPAVAAAPPVSAVLAVEPAAPLIALEPAELVVPVVGNVVAVLPARPALDAIVVLPATPATPVVVGVPAAPVGVMAPAPAVPTAGFVAKWYIFSAAVEQGYIWLAIIGVLTSVISVFYYLRIVVMMYMSDQPSSAPVTSPSAASIFALAVPTAATFYLGLLPTRVLEIALESISTIL